jgi:hypothetical protein
MTRGMPSGRAQLGFGTMWQHASRDYCRDLSAGPTFPRDCEVVVTVRKWDYDDSLMMFEVRSNQA